MSSRRSPFLLRAPIDTATLKKFGAREVTKEEWEAGLVKPVDPKPLTKEDIDRNMAILERLERNLFWTGDTPPPDWDEMKKVEEKVLKRYKPPKNRYQK